MKKIICMILLFSLFSSLLFAGDLFVTTTDSSLAAWDKECFDLMVMRLRDTRALQKMMDAGQIFIMKKGIEVYIEDSTWIGAVELRPKGEIYTFWTFHEAIK